MAHLRISVQCLGPRTGIEALEAALQVHGAFDVCRNGDAILLLASRLVTDVPASDVPTIVLARWSLAPEEAERMVAAGAEDVVSMPELNPSRLEAAVRKALVRTARRLVAA